MKRLFVLSLGLFMSACGGPSGFHGPSQFAQSTNVFNDLDTNGGLGIASIPQGDQVMLSAEYDAPYEDVFRVAEISAAQSQFFVEKKNKDDGIIYAYRSQPVEQHISYFIPEDKYTGTTSGWIISEKRYFLISINEIDAEKTSISIINKVQYECRAAEGVFHSSDECQKLTEPHWPTYQQADSQALESFLNFVRSNLISAGII